MNSLTQKHTIQRSKFIVGLLCCALSYTTSAHAQTDNSAPQMTAQLLQATQQAKSQQQQQQQQREAGFKETAASIAEQRKTLLAERSRLQQQTKSLGQQFTANENKLAARTTELELASASLGELFAVVRQAAKQLVSELSDSVTTIDRNHYANTSQAIVAAQSLPTISQLNGLWQGYVEQINASGELAVVKVNEINGAGQTLAVSALRLGSIGVIGEQGYLAWDSAKQQATGYLQQPEQGPVSDNFKAMPEAGIAVILDPSRGALLTQLANTPSLQDRLAQGGAVGYVIVGLLAVGLIIALIQGIKLMRMRHQIKRQLANPVAQASNALGRVLLTYQDSHAKGTLTTSTEALELQLMTVIMDEQSSLDKGLSMLKLLAALAPMLGLLGTVTGMIETFQLITQFGNGDPKVMAAGISMALVTTVLGLVAAMPLLLAHNILTTQADIIRDVLEKQGLSLVATEAELLAINSANNRVGQRNVSA